MTRTTQSRTRESLVVSTTEPVGALGSASPKRRTTRVRGPSCLICGRIIAKRHYQQGTCDACLPLRDLDPEARIHAQFFARVNKDGPVSEYCPDLGPCWIWTGSIVRQDGYGRLTFDGRTQTAQRASCRVHGIDVPEGMQVDHLCRVHLCVNPDHFDIVTAQENVLRGIGPTASNAVKTHCIRGHEYTPENTIYQKRCGKGNPPGRFNRVCRKCQSIRWQALKASRA
jgi:hypothetical protein